MTSAGTRARAAFALALLAAAACAGPAPKGVDPRKPGPNPPPRPARADAAAPAGEEPASRRAATAATAATGPIIARGLGICVTASLLEEALLRQPPVVQDRVLATPERRTKFLDDVIRFELMVAEGRLRGLHRDPADLAELERRRTARPGRDERHDADELVVRRLLRLWGVEPPPQPPESDVRAYHEANLRDRPLEEVRAQIASRLAHELAQNLLAAKVQQLREGAAIEIDRAALDGFTMAVPPDTVTFEPAGRGEDGGGRRAIVVKRRLGMEFPRLFASPGRHDLFWLEYPPAGSGSDLVSAWLPLSADLVPAREPRLLASRHSRHLAATPDRGRFAYVERVPPGSARLAVCARSDAGLDCAPGDRLPLDGPSAETGAVAYDPERREWGVLWEDVVGLERRQAVFRLYFARFTPSGRLVDGSRLALTPEAVVHRSARLSTRGEPLIWTPRGFAFVWAWNDTKGEVCLGELAPDRAAVTRVVDAGTNAFNATLAFDGERYGVAWDHVGDGGRRHELHFTTLAPGWRSAIVRLGGTVDTLTNPAITAAGKGFGVVWTERDPARRTPSVFFAHVDETSKDTRGAPLTEPDAGGTAEDVDFDGTRVIATVREGGTKTRLVLPPAAGRGAPRR